MSTLRLTTISNQTGSSSVPSETVINGSAKAWVNFNGTGTVAIRAAFNVSSITDNGAGEYTINFTVAMVDANYSISAAARIVANAGCVVVTPDVTNTTTAYRISTRPDPQSAGIDAAFVYFQVFR